MSASSPNEYVWGRPPLLRRVARAPVAGVMLSGVNAPAGGGAAGVPSRRGEEREDMRDDDDDEDDDEGGWLGAAPRLKASP